MTSSQNKTIHLYFRATALLDKTYYYTDETHVKEDVKKMFGLESIKDITQEQFDRALLEMDTLLLENNTTIEEISRIIKVMEME